MANKALDALKQLTEEPDTIEVPATSVSKGMTTKEKWAAITAVGKSLNKEFKCDNSLVRLGDRVGKPVPNTPTGIYTLDHNVLVCGGLPKGRIIEIYGAPSSGKTSLTFKVIAEEQRLGNIVAFVDVEHALDPSYAATFGVNVDELVVSQPDGGEQALETVEALVRSGAVSLIVVDSVAALVPEKELSGDFGDANMGLQARLMSQACRKLRGICAINTVTVIFINQTRMNIGGYGSPVVTSGGKALSFYASVRLEVGRVSGEEGKIMSGGVQLGHRVKIKAVKNKVGPPFRTTEVDLIYNVGWDVEGDFIEYAVSLGAIEKKGSWLFLNGKQLSQGVNKLKDLIKADRSLYTEVEAEVQKALAAQKAVEDVKE
jgi:recombination protein RecA